MTYAIEAEGLVKYYGNKQVLQGLNMNVKTGEIFGLIGANGAGKSTTIDCLLGTKKLDQGTVNILGTSPTTKHKSLFEQIGVQFQESAFQNGLTVKEICEITHSLYKNPIDWRTKLADYQLEHHVRSSISTLSGGERQKLCILLATMGQPKLLVLDELTTGLDPVARRQIWNNLRKLNDEGVTILLTSHDMHEIEALCDRILLLKHGNVFMEGTVQEVLSKSGAKSMDDAYLQLTGEGIR
ncbi:hypothetical protein DH09_03110 [Bacillaceae bacterium JMAK1]|nr:hypothetical protein DH09_03110 [Bacillaceae bacterium JMAK1]